ncbi:neuroplastin [Bicyclus anynana]|uniref:Neuroplastin n=1 Tax=Bicyclus anynana TaxID=110368 RepID=A0ABM3LXY6_BICAN|nr:neuroplastin [Bicyclus anynana]
MARGALCLPFAFLLLASVIPSEAQKAEAEAGEESLVTVAQGAPLTVECRLRAEQRADWQRDGAAPPPDLRAAPESPAAPDARLAARLRTPHAAAHHAGLYTCAGDRRHRVRVVVLPAPGTEPALAPAADTADAAAAAADGLPELLYDVRGNISLQCPLANDKSLDYVWKKNDTDLSLVWEMKDRWTLERGGAELHVKRALEDDWGNYSCSVASAEHRWAVRGRPHVKLPANANVVEGQKLKLTCRVVGKPHPRVTWFYSNSSDGPFAPLDEASGATLADSEAGVPDGVLLLAAATRAHAGRYNCTARDAPAAASTTLRVKDMYAALWPFLGICAEVFVLCAVILLYERRRTKPDLDDSDADNHDQKKS